MVIVSQNVILVLYILWSFTNAPCYITEYTENIVGSF